jgi:cyclophilin family peptidyl-prolyl cis-trans isomerase
MLTTLHRTLPSVIWLTILVLAAGGALAQDDAPRVRIETTMGPVVLELYPDQAPKTVENFLGYVRGGFYDGTIFHRVIDRFMIQGGGYDASMTKKPVRDPIQNESDNGLSNERGTIAMARTGDPHSATAQFYINTVDNSRSLDYDEASSRWGYAVFGKVVEGMEVVDEISGVPTGVTSGMRDVPRDPVVIEKVTVVE